MLPLTPNTAYGPEVPVKSADLNDVQACIVANKHGELEVPIHAAAFLPGSGAPAFGGIDWAGVAGAAFTLFAPIYVPVGRRITRARFGYNRNNAGHVIVSLIYFDLPTGVGPNLVTQFDDNVAPVANTYHELAAINQLVATGQAYALKFAVDATASAAGAHVGTGAAYFIDNI